MGCGASKQTVNTVEDAPPMKQKEATEPVDVPLQEKPKAQSQDQLNSGKKSKNASKQNLEKAKSNDKLGSKPVAFEIPVDDLKVPSGQLTTSKSQTNLDPEALKEKLKAKEDQAEENRQKQLEQIQAKAARREEQMKKAAERRQENGSTGNLSTGGEGDPQPLPSGSQNPSKSNLAQ